MINEFAGNLGVLGVGTFLIVIALVMTFNKGRSHKKPGTTRHKVGH